MFRFRTVLRAPTDGTPEGGGAAAPAPTQTPTQSALPLTEQPPAPAEPAKSKIDPADPELLKLVREASKKAAEEARTAERAKIEEEARLAKLDAENRAKEEKRKAEGDAATAKAEAEKAKVEAAFTRGLLVANLVPQTELAESMALAAAQELVKQGVPWADAVKRVGTEHAYLFRQTAAPAQPAAAAPGGAAPAQPASSPSTVQAARTLTTGTSQPTSGGAAPVVVNAFDMSPEQWAKAQLEIRQGRRA